ncbi:MAG TPA: nuclear transport factor 2 family protein [Hyphomonadaceae bacterium]|nr:nuclear transport factor 2 family protein [Hyphomonadaceae bacterium]
MNAQAPIDFQEIYLSTWTEPDPEQRRSVIEAVWAPEGRLVISPAGMTLNGTEEISTHIARVHADMIAGKQLTFSYDQQLAADDATLLRWSMTAPSGDVVGRGVDVVFRNADGQVTTLYMFMGVK